MLVSRSLEKSGPFSRGSGQGAGVLGSSLLLGAFLNACSAAQPNVPVQAPVPPAAPGSATPGVREPKPPLPADVVAKAARPMHVLIEPGGEQKLSEPGLWDVLAESRVVCFGEQHDSPQHHYAQSRALAELAARARTAQRPLGVGFEMFQRPYQPALTGFVTGALPEEQFIVDSQYKERWGFDFALYRPLLETARDYHLDALALNAPKELSRKIGRSGLGSLDEGEKAQLPELDLTNPDHKSFFDSAMSEHPMPPGGPKLEDMYAAQVLWDETMAETASRWLEQASPNSQLVVIAGNGHCHHSAIPARITRRTRVPVLSVTPVLASELSSFRDRVRYDWLFVLED
jgi:uncharacterized iron-regulated protein